MTFKVPEQYRLKNEFGGPKGETFGSFEIPSPDKSSFTKRVLMVIASSGMPGVEWEHVSVRADKNIDGKWKSFIPTWAEMCFIKSLFWDEEDVVMQLHPAKSEYVNQHPAVLHLWRPIAQKIPTPPSILVGFKSANVERV